MLQQMLRDFQIGVVEWVTRSLLQGVENARFPRTGLATNEHESIVGTLQLGKCFFNSRLNIGEIGIQHVLLFDDVRLNGPRLAASSTNEDNPTKYSAGQ